MAPTRTQFASPDELLDALVALDAAMDRIRRDAGIGVAPEHEYSLLALMRRLRSLAGSDALVLASDLRDAALRALDAADPAPALVVLELAYGSLRGLLHRLAGYEVPRAA